MAVGEELCKSDLAFSKDKTTRLAVAAVTEKAHDTPYHYVLRIKRQKS